MKLRLTYVLAALLCAILSMVSCVYDEHVDVVEGPGLIFRVRTQSSTKVSYDGGLFSTAFENNDVVGCVIASKSVEGYTFMSNTKWNFQNGVLMLQDTDNAYIKKVADETKAAEGYVELAGGLAAYSFFFYYPYVDAEPGDDFPKSGESFLVQQAGEGNWTDFPLFVNLEQTTKGKVNCSDFMWVGYTMDQKSGNDITMSNANYPVNLEFRKKTATIEVLSDAPITNVLLKTTVPATGDPSPISRGCSIDLRTGEMGNLQTITSEEEFQLFDIVESSERFRLLLPAQTNFSATLSFTLNEKSYSANLSNLRVLEEGKLYIIYIASDDGSIIINDWMDGGYSDLEEILPGQIVVTKMTAERFKAGYTVTITGEELEETASVRMSGALITEFTVNGDGTVLTFVIPDTAKDGQVVLVSDSASESVAGEVILVKPSEVVLTPSSIKPGETFTITGNDLDLVKGVTFGGDVYVDVTSTETKISLTVPASAVTGKVMLELKNGTSIEGGVLTVLQPSVTSMTADRFKAGNVVTITGENLDMVKSVVLPGSGEVAMSSHTAETITFTLPELAQDGQIILVNEYDGEIVSDECILELVKPAVTSYSPSDGVAVGGTLTIYGTDLDLISGVIFNGESNPVTPDEGGSVTSITVTVPSAAVSGNLKLVLVNGTIVESNNLIVRGNPDITSITRDGSSIYVNGTDLDLATAVKINGNTLSADKYSVNSEGTQIVISINASEIATLGISGSISVENNVVDAMTYDFTPAVTSFDKTTVSVGETVTLSGANLDLVGSVTFTGGVSCEVASASYSALSFVVPEGAQTGNITLSCLDSATTVTPGSITIKEAGSEEETVLWTGEEDMKYNACLLVNFDWNEVDPLTQTIKLIVNYTTYGESPHTLILLDGNYGEVGSYDLQPSESSIIINITSEIYNKLTWQYGPNNIRFRGVNIIINCVSISISD